jgi:hypothetical protein
MQGKKQYAEKLFTGFQLSSPVPEDRFYRRLKSALDLQWLYKATKSGPFPSMVACPSSFKTKLGEKGDGIIEGFYHNTHIVQAYYFAFSHMCTYISILQTNIY